MSYVASNDLPRQAKPNQGDPDHRGQEDFSIFTGGPGRIAYQPGPLKAVNPELPVVAPPSLKTALKSDQLEEPPPD